MDLWSESSRIKWLFYVKEQYLPVFMSEILRIGSYRLSGALTASMFFFLFILNVNMNASEAGIT